MTKLNVTNNGVQDVHRFGFTFKPGEMQEIETANAHQLIAIQAVRALDVVVQEEPQEQSPAAEIKVVEVETEAVEVKAVEVDVVEVKQEVVKAPAEPKKRSTKK